MPRREAWSAERIAMLLGARKTGFRWKAKCPAHDDSSPSLIIWRDKRDGRGAFYCAAGCAWSDVADQLRARGAVIGRRLKPEDIPPLKRIEEDEDRKRLIERAKLVWAEGLPGRGTRVERYLRSRKLELPAELDYTLVRFHLGCPRGLPDGGFERVPAMLVGLRDPVTKFICGISRTFLDPDGGRIGERRAAGSMGAAMFDPAADHMHVCEGFETGLALYLDDHRPVWALMSAGKLERLPLLDGVNHLRAYLDNDESETGWKAGKHLRWRWEAAGDRQVDLFLPTTVGSDYADVYEARHG